MNNPIMMNGPIELEMKIWIINPEKQQAGSTTIQLSKFVYPTPQSIAARLTKFEAEELVGPFAGFRLMTKHEAFEAMTFEHFGEAAKLIAPEEWDAIE